MAIIIAKYFLAFFSQKLQTAKYSALCYLWKTDYKFVNAVSILLNPGWFVNQLVLCLFSVLKMKRKWQKESITEEAATTSTTMFNSFNEENLPSNSSVIPGTLADKQLNLPISDLSPSQELESPSSLSLPALPEFSSPTSTVTLRSPLSISERESICEESDALRKERDSLLEENTMLSVKSSGYFSANVIKECPEKCKILVGISFPVLKKLFKYCVVT